MTLTSCPIVESTCFCFGPLFDYIQFETIRYPQIAIRESANLVRDWPLRLDSNWPSGRMAVAFAIVVVLNLQLRLLGKQDKRQLVRFCLCIAR